MRDFGGGSLSENIRLNYRLARLLLYIRSGGGHLKPIVKGFATGQAKIIKEYDHNHEDEVQLSPEEELSLLQNAIDNVDGAIDRMIDTANSRNDSLTSSIMEVHKMLLADEALITEIEDEIHKGHSARKSVQNVFDTWISTFKAMDNDYMNERSTDLMDIQSGLISAIVNPSASSGNVGSQKDQCPIILFTPELTPSQLASMNVDMLKGIVTKTGGETSHAAIMCKSLDIPMVVGNYSDQIEEDSRVLLDGVTGQVYINPHEEVYLQFKDQTSAYNNFRSKLERMTHEGLLVHDGLQVNLGDLDDLNKAVEAGAQGVGLFRTEFLFMKSKSVPSEEEQYTAYKKVLSSFGERPVTIRTIDIGGDKALPYLNMPKEENPFLGYRAIRMCLGSHEDLFRDQLRAILRASVHGKARIMFPMIANTQEIIKAKEILKDEQDKLIQEGIAFDTEIPVGIMIEVPSAALLSHHLAKQVDFFSIGTNDLTQYTMAADRMNNDVAYLYSYFEPAVLSLVQHVIESAKANEIDVSVCGEMASDPMAIPLLLEMGLEKFSVSPSRVNASRYIYTQLNPLKGDQKLQLLDFSLERKDLFNQSEAYMQKIFNQELSWL